MALLHALFLATSLGYAVGEKICPQGSIDGVPFACYDAGNDTAIYGFTGTGLPAAPIVATMRTQDSLMLPKPKTTTTRLPEPTPPVVCKCVQPAALDGGEYYENMTLEGRPIPQNDNVAVQTTGTSTVYIAPIVQTMYTQTNGLLQPTGTTSCTTTCITAFPTYASPRVESTQTRLGTPKAPHLETPGQHTTLQGPDGTTTPPTKLPQMTTVPLTAHLENPGSTLDLIPITTTTNTHYIIHSQTLIPGGPATVLEGTTYSLPPPVILTFTKSGGVSVVEPTQPAIVYVNGQAVDVAKIPGLDTDTESGVVASYINQGIGGGGEYVKVTMTESVPYSTSGGVTLYTPRVHVTQTRLKVPSGTTSTLATSRSTTVGSGGSQTTSGEQALQTGSAPGRATASAVCLGAVMFAVAML